MSLYQRFAERALRARLATLTSGALAIRDAAGVRSYGADAEDPVEVVVLDARAYPAIALGGHLGAAESYAEGWWTTDNLTALIQLFARNRDTVDALETGWARLLQPVRWIGHALDRNTRRGSKRNIGAHYDLSNEFFSLFLDETMTYSCGVFDRPRASLRDASIAKYERMAKLLELGSQHHVLEIGTGWGGFAMYVAERYGCRVTTTTISRQQFALASSRVRDAGLQDLVTVIEKDYRDLTGQYDRIVSIEMIEAVGHEYYTAFFERCASLLTPTGRLALQSITIDDRRYDAARKEVDFIKKYIFPGSNIPSLTALCVAASRTDLRLDATHEIGLHYAETMRRWRENFFANADRIRALGFDERFLRLWNFYFCYCEGGFLERAIGNVQLAFAKPAALGTLPFVARPGEREPLMVAV